MKQLTVFKHPLTNGLCWGIAGGILMIILLKLPFKSNITGTIMLVIFALCLIASLITIKLNDSDIKFQKLFITSLLTFMIIPIVAHIFLFLTNISNYNFNWVGPFFIMLAIGVVICSALTFLVVKKR